MASEGNASKWSEQAGIEFLGNFEGKVNEAAGSIVVVSESDDERRTVSEEEGVGRSRSGALDARASHARRATIIAGGQI